MQLELMKLLTLDCINSVFDLVNSTILYTEWIKFLVFSEDIIHIGPEIDTQNSNGKEYLMQNPVKESSSVIEIHFDLEQRLKLKLIRKSKIIGKPKVEFEVLFTTYAKSSKPKGIDLKILIKGTKISSSKTNLQMYFEVSHKHSLFTSDISEQLSSAILESLQGLPLIVNEKSLQNNLITLDALKRNSIMKHQFYKSLEEEKEIAEEFKETLEETKLAKTPQRLSSESSKSEENQKEALDIPDDSWRKKCQKDGIWLKWVVERLATIEQVEKYNELKSRIYNKHGLSQVSESLMLRFLYGLEFDIDLTETKVVQHIAFMNENNLWTIDESRIPNIIKDHVLIVYKQDIYERPINYMRMGRFLPSNYELEEIRTYCFWNLMNVMKSFKPYVESNIAIYDLKGLSNKNVSLSLFK